MTTELVREALRDGRPVARIRCYDGDGSTVVEVDADETGIHRLYRFAAAPEAFRFVQEAVLALQYLGCTVQ